MIPQEDIYILAPFQVNEITKTRLAELSQTCGNFVGDSYENWCQIYPVCSTQVFLHILRCVNSNNVLEEIITGYALLINAKDNIAEIFDVCFSPDYRGRGFAKTLIQSIVNYVNTNNYVCWLGIKDTNPFFDSALVFVHETRFYIRY